ncbi:MAG TPA: hypothetical protein VN892_04575 [Solirubrobacteraceae bacterium]|nr:hypothetical protein [Solirubrobacteraceae bacterium]
MGIAGQPVQVRNPDGAGVDTSEGPFLRSDFPIAWFALIEASTLIGQVTEQCILYSALNAYVRRYSITVPRDAVGMEAHGAPVGRLAHNQARDERG